MSKVITKKISCILLVMLSCQWPTRALLVRFSLYTKNHQRIILCGDNHVIGTPKNNLQQWYSLLEEFKNLHNTPITLLVENQRLISQWFNDPIDRKIAELFQHDTALSLDIDQPGKLTMLSLIGLPATFFPFKYRKIINRLTIFNIECRQFLLYTTLLDTDILMQNITDRSLIKSFKELQQKKITNYSLDNIFNITKILNIYKNNCNNSTARVIFDDIGQRIDHNWQALKKLWHQDFPDLNTNNPIATHKIDIQQSVYASLLTSQFMDEMIEANTLWHIIRPNSPKTIIALVGSVHSGHLDIIHVKYTLAEYLKKLGYKLQASFGLQDIHNVDDAYCQRVATELPQELALWLKKPCLSN